MVLWAFVDHMKEKLRLKYDKDLEGALLKIKEIPQKTLILDEDSYPKLISTPNKETRSGSISMPYSPFKKDAQLNSSPNNKELSSSSLMLDSVIKDLETAPVCFKSFVILEKIGEGAFGKIFRVKKKDNGCIYAMKVLSK